MIEVSVLVITYYEENHDLALESTYVIPLQIYTEGKL